MLFCCLFWLKCTTLSPPRCSCAHYEQQMSSDLLRMRRASFHLESTRTARNCILVELPSRPLNSTKNTATEEGGERVCYTSCWSQSNFTIIKGAKAIYQDTIQFLERKTRRKFIVHLTSLLVNPHGRNSQRSTDGIKRRYLKSPAFLDPACLRPKHLCAIEHAW